MKRRVAIALAVIAVAAFAIYHFALGPESVPSSLKPVQPIAVIGSGAGAVGVSASGAVLSWQPPPRGSPLPRLPISTPPRSGQLVKTMLAQARVLGAAPAALRPYLTASRYGASGVDVELSTGVELRFGDAAGAARKWKSAAAVLADPAVSALDYVNLQIPGRPSIGGSGHPLPTAP